MAIRTPRLLLRPVRLDDVDLWHEMDQDPDVLQHLRLAPPTLDESREAVERQVAQARLHHGYGFWSAFLVDRDERPGDFVGWFHLRPGQLGDEPDVLDPELGYRLRREFWGRGLASEGSRALVEEAFTRLNAHRVHADTVAENHRSRAVMEALGMNLVDSRQVTIPQLGPEERTVVWYAITLVEWLDRVELARDQLHERQAHALALRRAGDPSASDELATLRQIGMDMARIEAGDSSTGPVRASDDLVRKLAQERGMLTP